MKKIFFPLEFKHCLASFTRHCSKRINSTTGAWPNLYGFSVRRVLSTVNSTVRVVKHHVRFTLRKKFYHCFCIAPYKNVSKRLRPIYFAIIDKVI